LTAKCIIKMDATKTSITNLKVLYYSPVRRKLCSRRMWFRFNKMLNTCLLNVVFSKDPRRHRSRFHARSHQNVHVRLLLRLHGLQELLLRLPGEGERCFSEDGTVVHGRVYDFKIFISLFPFGRFSKTWAPTCCGRRSRATTPASSPTVRPARGSPTPWWEIQWDKTPLSGLCSTLLSRKTLHREIRVSVIDPSARLQESRHWRLQSALCDLLGFNLLNRLN